MFRCHQLISGDLFDISPSKRKIMIKNMSFNLHRDGKNQLGVDISFINKGERRVCVDDIYWLDLQ